MWRVYPRRCGEANRQWFLESLAWGLSPQVRGSLWPWLQFADSPGSIPAGAGKPSETRQSKSQCQVYPHRCGEALRIAGQRRIVQGLSPQVRGSPLDVLGATWHSGSIPAGAGKPTQSRKRRRIYRVYPRRCGEAMGRTGEPAVMEGLSPQVRGSLTDPQEDAFGDGSIPAGAGKPVTLWSLQSVATVYPRRCGEAAKKRVVSRSCRGLSPQVRGSPCFAPARSTGLGSIPAGAGKPPRTRR